jgi:hypothetical protein
MKHKKLNKIDYFLIAVILLMLVPAAIAGWKATYSQLTTPADGDAFQIVDISDDTMAATGTTKYIEWSDIITALSSFSAIEMPNGTALNSGELNATGEFGLDTSDYQFIIYGNSEDLVYTHKHRQCFTLEEPADTDDNVPIFSLDDGFTVTDMRCWTEGGTNVVMFLSDGTDALDSMTCDADGTNDDGTISNATFTADEQMEFDITSVSGEVTWVNYCFTYTITRE